MLKKVYLIIDIQLRPPVNFKFECKYWILNCVPVEKREFVLPSPFIKNNVFF